MSDKPLNIKPAPRILVSSISRKVPLLRELERGLKKVSPSSIIIGADSDERCIASHFVDEFWHMPKLDEMSEHSFINKLIELKISGMQKNAISLMLPDSTTVNTCLDKLAFSDTLTKFDFPVIPAAKNINELKTNSYVVKEQFGAGSSSIFINVDKKNALIHADKLKSAIFQPYMEGDEYSIDVYFDKHSNFKGAVSRKRDLVINGESQVSSTVNEPEMEQLCEKIGSVLKLVGHAIFQIIKTVDAELHIIELNTRFGGASTLSITAGLDSFYWFGLESVGISVDSYQFIRSPTNLMQVRYPTDKIIEI